MKQVDNKMDKYIKIVCWARQRYRDTNALVLNKGRELSRYSEIEHAAWAKYSLNFLGENR